MRTPTESEFAITNRAELGATVVAVAGELDLYRIPALTEALHSVPCTGRVVVDLREVTFLDSTTLALFVRAHRRLQEAGRELILWVGKQTPMRAFTVTGIDRVLAIESVGPDEETRSS
ncbi:MAG: STAS domain-containing protein [Gaiellaceae bacterium]